MKWKIIKYALFVLLAAVIASTRAASAGELVFKSDLLSEIQRHPAGYLLPYGDAVHLRPMVNACLSGRYADDQLLTYDIFDGNCGVFEGQRTGINSNLTLIIPSQEPHELINTRFITTSQIDEVFAEDPYALIFIGDVAVSSSVSGEFEQSSNYDGDGLSNTIEVQICTNSLDADTDDDGILDGDEDADHDGVLGLADNETHPCNPDTDGDGILDGAEVGLTADDIGPDTDPSVFQPDEDPSTTTDPTLADTDGDGVSDGEEDWDKNGQVDPGEGDPNDEGSLPNNTAPTTPSLNQPADRSEVTSQVPVLSINNSSDANGHGITYTFELYADEALTNLTASVADIAEGTGTTAWQIDDGDALADHTTYYWRCRAFDGYDFSDWMATAQFFVNTANEAPGVPAVSTPADQSSVPSQQPVLTVTNAANMDGDTLTYEYEVYADNSMADRVTSQTGVLEGNGTTGWQVDVALTDNTWYWWRAQARDDEGLGSGWTQLHTFMVDTANEAPTGLSLSYPQADAEVASVDVALEFNNATDPEGGVITYDIQIDESDTFDGPEMQSASDIEEGTGGVTTWQPGVLNDNTFYYWRVRAYDGAVYSAWVSGRFFVNTANDAPGAPGISSPADGAQVSSATPTLTATSAVDLDQDVLTYSFEVYDDSALTNLTDSGISDTLSWQVPSALVNFSTYYWRVSATDEHDLQGPWSLAAVFSVNINQAAPEPPTINDPSDGGVVHVDQPILSVLNGHDAEGADLTYLFEVYADPGLVDQIATGSVAEGASITSWQVSAPLENEATYYWRVKVSDGTLESSWTSTAVFLVCLDGCETEKELLAYGDVDSASPDVQVVSVNDPNSPLNGTRVEIEPGSLSADLTVTISQVLNPPSLPPDVVSLGLVVDFGPDGTQFNLPVTIYLPYSQSLLDQAGITDPDEINIFFYNTAASEWETVAVDSVDTNSQMVVFSTSHFSMYRVAAEDRQTGSPNSGSGGGGGGGCFINTVDSGT